MSSPSPVNLSSAFGGGYRGEKACVSYGHRAIVLKAHGIRREVPSVAAVFTDTVIKNKKNIKNKKKKKRERRGLWR